MPSATSRSPATELNGRRPNWPVARCLVDKCTAILRSMAPTTVSVSGFAGSESAASRYGDDEFAGLGVIVSTPAVAALVACSADDRVVVVSAVKGVVLA